MLVSWKPLWTHSLLQGGRARCAGWSCLRTETPYSSPTFSLVPKGAWDRLILELQLKGLRKDICSQEAYRHWGLLNEKVMTLSGTRRMPISKKRHWGFGEKKPLPLCPTHGAGSPGVGRALRKAGQLGNSAPSSGVRQRHLLGPK